MATSETFRIGHPDLSWTVDLTLAQYEAGMRVARNPKACAWDIRHVLQKSGVPLFRGITQPAMQAAEILACRARKERTEPEPDEVSIAWSAKTGITEVQVVRDGVLIADYERRDFL